MEQYISKSALVAEIKKRAIEAGLHDGVIAETREDECYSILSLIDTLEVKEVDLEKELSYEDYIRFFEEHPNFPDDWGFDEAWVFAKHFFELGIKVAE